MNLLIHHIEYLLTKHDCVCVPGLGGFLLSYHEACLSDNDVINPPAKSVQFNKSLNYNDGLLINSLMNEKKISYSEAEYIVTTEIISIKQRLSRGETEKFGSIGSLAKNEEGNLEFTESESRHNFDLSLYGFLPVALTRLTPKEKLDQVTDTEKVRSKKISFFRNSNRIAYVIILIISFLLFSPSINHVDQSQNQASLVNPQLISDLFSSDFNYYKYKGEVFSDNIVTEYIEAVSDDNSSLVEEVEIFSPTEEITEIAPAVQSVKKPLKRYYVIIGSFPDRSAAMKHIGKLNEIGISDISILEKSDRFRLYIKTFEDKDIATDYLETLRETTSFKDAWLLSHRS